MNDVRHHRAYHHTTHTRRIYWSACNDNSIAFTNTKMTHEFRTFIIHCGRLILLDGLLSLSVFILNAITVHVTWTIAYFYSILCHSPWPFHFVYILCFCEQKMDHFSLLKFEMDWMMIVFFFTSFGSVVIVGFSLAC